MEFFSHLLPESQGSLVVMDAALHVIHLALILFVLFGAFFRKLVKWHFPVLVIIWISWGALGYYIGTLGYCPLTDWHWQVKAREGEVKLPASYIEYCYAHITGQDVDDKLMSNIIACVMLMVTLFSGVRFWTWWKKR